MACIDCNQDLNFSIETGPQGPTGATGPAGADGNDGAVGPDGAAGAVGADGADNIIILESEFNQLSTVATGVWTSVHTYTLPGGTLDTDGEYLDIDLKIWSSAAPDGDRIPSAGIKLEVGGQTLKSRYPITGYGELLALSNADIPTQTFASYYLNIKAVRIGSDTLRYMVTWSTHRASFPTAGHIEEANTGPGLDFTNNILIDFQLVQALASAVSIEMISIKHIKGI
jgi:hypothetical protein